MLYKFVRNFLWNLRDSFRFSIRLIHKDTQEVKSKLSQPQERLKDDLLIEQILYEIPTSGIKRPNIKTAEETINELIHTNKNFVRYGDGEIMVADGKDIPFQKADKELSRRLREILTTPQENLLVGVNRRYYYPNAFTSIIKQKNPIYKHFELYAVPKLRRELDKYIKLNITYYEAGITGRNETHFNTFRQFFTGKKLVLVGCKEAFENLKFNIYDTAQELYYEFVPNKHCFSVYDETLAKLQSYDKDTIRILMCGPTANVFVTDLTKSGFRALDLGHLAKSYDWHKRGIDMDKSGENVVKFFSPDEFE